MRFFKITVPNVIRYLNSFIFVSELRARQAAVPAIRVSLNKTPNGITFGTGNENHKVISRWKSNSTSEIDLFVADWMRNVLETSDVGSSKDQTNIPTLSKDFYYTSPDQIVKKYCFNKSSEQVLGSNPKEGIEVCKSIIPVRHGVTLNIRRTNPRERLMEKRDRRPCSPPRSPPSKLWQNEAKLYCHLHGTQTCGYIYTDEKKSHHQERLVLDKRNWLGVFLHLKGDDSNFALKCGHSELATRGHWGTEWRYVAFYDESRLCLGVSDVLVLVRRRPGECLQANSLRLRHTGPIPGVLIWRTIFYDCRSILVVIPNTLTANLYVNLDNARPHTAVVTQRALQSVDMLPRPARSLNLSSVEHARDINGRQLQNHPQPALTVPLLTQQA
ncbi:uncharacterized protein TNCV_1711091 [Trichonephila clavipes]|nr:uncharacterized protein TNCV_1711091 [Trichonephila clavipes]